MTDVPPDPTRGDEPAPEPDGGARGAPLRPDGYAWREQLGPPPPPWPPDPRDTPAPRRRAMVLVAVLALIALVITTTAGITLRDNSGSTEESGFGFRPGIPTDDTRVDESFADEFGVDVPTDIDVNDIAEAVSPAIVNLRVTLASGYATAGSGLVITRSGHVLTNNHVINGAREIAVEFGTTGETTQARVLGYDMGDDVALLKLADVSGLQTIRTAPSTTVSRRDSVVAIGNALGAFGEPSAVPGRVTALRQAITAGDGAERETLPNMIRFSGSIRPGDSGGALVDARGRVVGMNTAADPGGTDRFGTSSGTTGFAIPIETAIAIANQIRAGDDSNGVHIGARALLGVALSDRSEAGPFDDAGDGALVTDVGNGTPAAAAGIDDDSTIVAVAGRSIGSNDDLREALDRYHPGDRVIVRWIDASGDARQARVTLTEGPPA